ncbi:flagellar hook associated protein [Rhizobium sp. AAP43]|uniref:flagellin N-terminal helical domain-containing protein n=1 Tax=Rhizobium sp. AAP43 TaxID=1523420 RepID=UPI0006CD0696|nr:flagellar hook associated protein [Rhizobium sp. AAP43]KPF45602.1 hypothetical protein IP76_08370 [Rhizobium sp. AAP43]
MTSVSFNPTSTSAASRLAASSVALDASQRQTASAKTVARAQDDAAYWSIATTMRAESLSMTAVQDANSLAAAMTDTAASGLDKATDVVAQIQQKLIIAKSVGANRATIGSDINEMKGQLASIAVSGGFAGENWLQVEEGSRPKVAALLASVTSNGAGDLSINMIDFDTGNSTLISKQDAADGMLTRAYSGTTISGVNYNYYLLDAGSAVGNGNASREIRVDQNTTSDELDGMITTLNRVMIDMVGASADVSSTRNRISANVDFVEDLQGLNDAAVSQLVDADMGEQSAREAALGAQRQLQASGLNIANNSMSLKLSLFL